MTQRVRTLNKRRSKLEIILCILSNAREPIKPTRLMYATNLAWEPLKSKVHSLHEQGLLEKIEVEGDARSYVEWQTTSKGLAVLTYFADAPLHVDEAVA